MNAEVIYNATIKLFVFCVDLIFLIQTLTSMLEGLDDMARYCSNILFTRQQLLLFSECDVKLTLIC